MTTAELLENLPALTESDRVAYGRLLDIIRPHSRVIVAFSGGIDSSLLLKAALDALGPESVLAATACSPSVPQRELDAAGRIAVEIGASHRVVYTNEIKSEDYRRNDLNRCFFCKTELYGVLEKLKTEEGYEAVFNGTITDDLGDHRPGLKAAENQKVRAPLARAGFDKETVRRIARALELSVWDKPASPCLASRIPYFQSVSMEKLSQIEKAEDFLLSLGFRELRVRHHGELARLELPPEDFAKALEADLREKIVTEIKALGFKHVVLDLGGFKSGGLNPQGL